MVDYEQSTVLTNIMMMTPRQSSSSASASAGGDDSDGSEYDLDESIGLASYHHALSHEHHRRRKYKTGRTQIRDDLSPWMDDEDSEDELIMSNERQKTCKSWLAFRTRSFILNWVGDDWIALTLVGAVTALVGVGIDECISLLHQLRHIVINERSGFVVYLTWVIYTVLAVTIAAVVTHYISPHSQGSGIPQMKVILKGFKIQRFLTFRTGMAKIFGLIFAAGSGLPIGKEGPFVHIASVVAEMSITRLPILEQLKLHDTRRTQLLAAACAVGVASNFGSPIGGVLFSIEVTATYFAVANYWRGFYASVVGAFIFRFLAVVFSSDRTITTLFTTEFDEYPFDLAEMLVFIALGAVTGLLGAFFVFLHRMFVTWQRTYTSPGNLFDCLHKSRYLYTIIVTFIAATCTCPSLFGPYMSLTQNTEIDHLFSNKPLSCIPEWSNSNIFLSLSIFCAVKLLITALVMTLPIPAGVFVPVFVVGAALGRLVGELMAVLFPQGVFGGLMASMPDEVANVCVDEIYSSSHIVAGGYAVVGAAALAGAVTHTISTSVIVFELTGQMHHILPVMIAVLLSNAISQKLSPSFYDSMVKMTGMPYLPDLRKSATHDKTARDVMNPEVVSIPLTATYGRIAKLLSDTGYRIYPLVDEGASGTLVGSVQRHVLLKMLRKQIAKAAGQSETNEQPSGLNGRPESDITVQQRKEALMSQPVDFAGIKVDPAPFQLVGETSLHKVHTLFSLLGLRVAYVTTSGQLVGILGLEEIRRAVESIGLRKFESRFPHSRINFERSDDHDTPLNAEIDEHRV